MRVEEIEGRRPKIHDTRLCVRLTRESGERVVDLGPGDSVVEVIGSEAVLRAVTARPRDAVALVLLGRLRVRGSVAAIDQLAAIAWGE